MTQQDSNKKIVSDFRNELTNKHNPNAWDTFCSDRSEERRVGKEC